MNGEQYQASIESEIQSTIARLLPHGGGQVTETRLRSALESLAQRIARDTRSYELLNIRNSDELAQEWGVSKRRVQAHIAKLHERWGVGRKVGRDWLLSAEEAETHRPGAVGRPRKNSE